MIDQRTLCSSNPLPTIAVLLAVYNGEKHLEALLESLLEQDYPHFCIYIRDNCSKDRTREILGLWKTRFPEKILLYFSDKNEGVIKNFGALTELAAASYFMYCDGDDVWSRSKISRTFHEMKQMEDQHGSSTPLLIHTDLMVVNEELKEISPSFWKYAKLNTHKKCQELPRLLVQNHVTGCTIMINQALRDLAIPIPLDCVMHDWWLALVAATFGKVKSLPFATLKYRQHTSNDTGAKSYGFLGYYKQRLKNKYTIQEKKTTQVIHLLKRFKGNISDKNLHLCESYLTMQKAWLPYKILLIWKNGFLKSGFFRNFILNH